MPRKPRLYSPTSVYHWINRGVNQKHLFHSKDDYEHLLALLLEHKADHGVEIYHYCLMPNHIHILLKCEDRDVLSSFSKIVQRRYAYYYCKAHKWKGQVFQRLYKALPVGQDSYLLECGRYIERNPVRAKLAEKPSQYTYSSHAFYAGQAESKLLTPSPAYLGISGNEYERQESYKDYVNDARPYEDLLDAAVLKS